MNGVGGTVLLSELIGVCKPIEMEDLSKGLISVHDTDSRVYDMSLGLL